VREVHSPQQQQQPAQAGLLQEPSAGRGSIRLLSQSLMCDYHGLLGTWHGLASGRIGIADRYSIFSRESSKIVAIAVACGKLLRGRRRRLLARSSIPASSVQRPASSIQHSSVRATTLSALLPAAAHCDTGRLLQASAPSRRHAWPSSRSSMGLPGSECPQRSCGPQPSQTA